MVIAPYVQILYIQDNGNAGAVFQNYGIVATTTGTNPAVFFSSATANCLIENKQGATLIGVNALDIAGSSISIVNQGLMLGATGSAVLLRAEADNVSLSNSGDITGNSNGVFILGDGTNSISNFGNIRGEIMGIWLSGIAGAAPAIFNAGTIVGRQASIFADGGHRLNVTNTGTLVGNVEGASIDQPDRVINNGTVRGSVNLQSGADLYQGLGIVAGTVFGQVGNDTLIGGIRSIAWMAAASTTH
jgi:hypothetical protein